MQEFPIEHFHDISLHFTCSAQRRSHWMAWTSHLLGSTCYWSKLASEACCTFDADTDKLTFITLMLLLGHHSCYSNSPKFIF